MPKPSEPLDASEATGTLHHYAVTPLRRHIHPFHLHHFQKRTTPQSSIIASVHRLHTLSTLSQVTSFQAPYDGHDDNDDDKDSNYDEYDDYDHEISDYDRDHHE